MKRELGILVGFVLFAIGGAPTAFAEDLPAINSPPTQDYHPGKFVWGLLLTDQPEAATRFYTGLLGWTAGTIEQATTSGARPYAVLSVEGRPIAAVAQRAPRASDEAHARWMGFVSVPDVTKALALAAAHGGRALGPTKTHMPWGISGAFADGDGTVLGVIHSGTGDPGEFLPDPGDWAWAELFARNPGAAVDFYRDVIGYEAVQDTRTGHADAFILVSGGYSRAGLAPVPDHPNAHANWLLFVRVADVDATVALAGRLGGRVLVAPSKGTAEYRRAVIADPSGAHLGLVEIGNPDPDSKLP